MILCVNLLCFMFEFLGDKLIQKCVFGRSGLNLNVFEKLLISYSCISFMKYCVLRSFCIKMLFFFKNFKILDFQLIEVASRSIKIVIKNLVWIYLAWSMHDWCWIDRIYFSINRSLFSTNWNLIWKCFKEAFLTCSSHFSNFSKSFYTFSLWPIRSKPNLLFSSTNLSKVFVL